MMYGRTQPIFIKTKKDSGNDVETIDLRFFNKKTSTSNQLNV